MSKYEAVVVFSVKNGDDVSALVEKFKALIEKSGTLESVDEWVREDSLTLSTTRQRATTFSTTSRALRSSRLSLSV